MQEEHVQFRCGACELEGRYHAEHAAKAVVVTHPHPLYGGDLFNPVVEAITTAYQHCGFATLRFNFRGVGNSTGSHDQGQGEQRDVGAAIDWLRARDHGEIHLSGYSFGAWVNALAMQGDLAVSSATMVAPPVAFIEFPAGIRLPALTTIVAGSDDGFAPPLLIEPQMTQWNPAARLEIIHGADHFLFGFLDAVTRLLTAVLR
jgi:alpha/beta superfamily hydrolase